jgi:hypothetical protein
MSEERVGPNLLANLCNDAQTQTERLLALDLRDARREREEAIVARERAERERDEARATKDMHKARQEQEIARADQAERELALARPVIEAAHCAAWVSVVMPPEQQGLHIQTLVRAIRAYDAAREKGEKP